MKKLLMLVALFGFAVSPVMANECPTLQAQIDAEANRRFDNGAYQAKMLATEAGALHAHGKHAESVAKYDEAAKAAGMTLTHKK
jgi:hypothetical protein